MQERQTYLEARYNGIRGGITVIALMDNSVSSSIFFLCPLLQDELGQ